MVSGLVTSPCDQLRIFSGEARLMRIASKSAIGFPSSNGFERNNLSSCPVLPPQRTQDWRPLRGHSRLPVKTILRVLPPAGAMEAAIPILKRSVGSDGRFDQGFLSKRLDQLHIEAQRLQFANQYIERLRHTRLDGRFALDDGLINLRAAINIV